MVDRVRTLDAFINASTGLFRNARGIAAQDVRDLIVSMMPAFRGTLHGLTLSNNTTDGTNDLDFAAGVAWDNVNDVPLVLPSGLTKRLDAGHAAGTNAGGLDTGSKANSTTYHCHLVGRSDTAAIDACLSTNVSTPSLASAWDWNRRIGSIITNGSGAIRPFFQINDYFGWKTAVVDRNGTNIGTTATLVTLTVPSGIKVKAALSTVVGYKVSASPGLFVSSPDADDVACAFPDSMTHAANTTNISTAAADLAHVVFTNTSSQIRVRASLTDVPVWITTSGWSDTRGMNA